MASTLLKTVVRHVRSLAAGPAGPDAGDGELLTLFLAHHDEAAFAQILRRHGPMVLGVSGRILRHHHDAEDVFQATFLLLARNAAAIGRRGSVGAWLHGVAYRLALRARARRARRERHERRAPGRTPPTPGLDAAWRELREVLDGALAGLPEKYRVPLVLCYLEGKTQEEVARQLGRPLGTVRSWLARGRTLLQRRLARRGLALSAGALAAALVAGAAGAEAAALPPAVLRPTLHAALRLAAGEAVAEVAAAPVASLVEGGGGLAAVARVRLAAVLLLAGVVAAGAEALALPAPGAPPEGQPRSTAPDAPPARPAEAPPLPGTDRHDDPLPEGAIARLGTTRFQDICLYTVVFSPDGKSIAAGSAGRGLSLWDAATGKQVRPFNRAHQFSTIAFSPDGKTLVAAGAVVALYDVATGEVLRNLGDGKLPSLAAAFAPDGKAVATADFNGDIVLWDPATGKQLRSLKGHDCRASSLAFAPDGKLLASAGREGPIRLWDPAAGAEVRRLTGHTGKGVARVAFSPDGKRLASSGWDQTVRLWDVATGQEVRTLQVMDLGVSPLAFAPDGKALASGHTDGTVVLWDTATGKERRRWRPHLNGVGGLAFSPDGKVLATGAWLEKGPRLWDVATGREVRAPGGHHAVIDVLAFTADGKALVTAGRGEGVLRWDLASSRERRGLDRRDVPFDRFTLSPDGKWAATWNKGDDTLRVWDAATGKEVRSLGKRGGTPQEFWPQPPLAFSRDGRLLAAPDKDLAVRVWDVAGGKERVRLTGCRAPVSCVALSPDGKTLAATATVQATAAARAAATIHVWDVATGKELRAIATGQGTNVIAFSPDGTALASCGHHPGVRLWDVRTGAEVRPFAGCETGAYALAFSPDGRFLAAGGNDKWVYLWEVLTGQVARLYREGHWDGVCSLAFAPDGRSLATGGGDALAYVWDLTGWLKEGRWQAVVLTAPDLDSRWTDLAGEPGPAVRAVWDLAADPRRALPFLGRKLRAVEPADERRLARLLADLDDDDFAVRRQAAEGLRALGELAEPALRQELARGPSPEVRRAIEGLLGTPGGNSGERLRELRAVQAVEYAGTEEAKRLLRALARGAPAARLTREAKAALRRLETRPAP
jgi:RNA polymerase sigma factor (sigma-70 family)